MNRLFLRIYAVALLMMCAVGIHAQWNSREFYVYDASNGLADNSAQIVMCTKTGRMVVCTIGHVNFYDGYMFNHVDPSESDMMPLSGYSGKYQMYFDRHHHLWVKHNRMATCVDLLTERFISDVDSVTALLGVSHPIDDLYGDSQGNVWFRSANQLRGPDMKNEFLVRQPATLWGVELYKDSLLLMFHANGVVSVYDVKSSRYLYSDQIKALNAAGRYNQSSALCMSGCQCYWLLNGEDGSILLCYDVERRQWLTLLRSPLLMNAVCHKDQQLFIGTECGYMVYDISSGTHTSVETITLTKGRQLRAYVHSLAFDRQGGLWLGTERNGLLYSKPYPSPFSLYRTDSPEAWPLKEMIRRNLTKTSGSLLPRSVNCVYLDSRGWRWTGTFTGLQLDKPHGRRQTFTRVDGLTNEVIHCVIEDNEHNIWVGTSYGIAQLTIRGDSVCHLENYINQDNVPSESFLNGYVAKAPDGTIVMQSTDHVVAFNPSSFFNQRTDTIVLYPKLIRLTVNGSVIEAGQKFDDRVILERSVSRTREFSVDYDQNSLVLTFSALNYLRPVQTYYRVRVRGVRGYEQWRVFSYGKGGSPVDKGGLLRLALSGLRPGTYSVELQASLWPESWPQAPFTWVIHVEEPWWRTTGIYLSLAVLALVLLLINFYFYNRITRLRLIQANEEADILRRVKTFVRRCEGLSHEVLAPVHALRDANDFIRGNLSKEFVAAMLRIVPFINQTGEAAFDMAKLAAVAGVETGELYDLVSVHLDKNPLLLVAQLRLREAEKMLNTTDMSVEAIARACHYASPNYFIASFYHHYRQTPASYRKMIAR